jgi:hypothetical protein
MATPTAGGASGGVAVEANASRSAGSAAEVGVERGAVVGCGRAAPSDVATALTGTGAGWSFLSALSRSTGSEPRKPRFANSTRNATPNPLTSRPTARRRRVRRASCCSVSLGTSKSSACCCGSARTGASLDASRAPRSKKSSNSADSAGGFLSGAADGSVLTGHPILRGCACNGEAKLVFWRAKNTYLSRAHSHRSGPRAGRPFKIRCSRSGAAPNSRTTVPRACRAPRQPAE